MAWRTAIGKAGSASEGRPRPLAANRSDGLVVATLGVFGVALTLAHRLNADEGQVLTGAWNLVNGSRLYEDFFEFIGPASSVWISLFFKAFGASYASALAASQILLVASIGAFYATGRLLIRKRAPVLAVSLLWILLATTPPFVNHNTFSTYLATLVTLLLVRTVLTGSAATAFGGGVVAGLTVFFLQPKGIALVVVGTAALAWRSGNEPTHGRRPFVRPLAYGTGAALVAAIGVAAWGLSPFTTVLSVASGNVAMNHAGLSLAPLLLALGLAGLMYVACYREGLLDRVTVLLFLLQAGLWASTLHLPDPWHLALNAFPLLLVSGRLAARVGERQKAPAWRTGMGGLLALVLAIGVVRAVSRNVRDTQIAREWIDVLERVLGEEEFYVFTFLPSFYLELRAPNPYYNSVLYSASNPPEHFERNVDILARREPRFVLADYSTVQKYGHTLDNPVDRFIRRRYRRVRELPHAAGVIEVWELRTREGVRR